MVVRERNDTGRNFCRMVSDLLKTLDDVEQVDELFRDFVLIGNSLESPRALWTSCLSQQIYLYGPIRRSFEMGLESTTRASLLG